MNEFEWNLPHLIDQVQSLWESPDHAYISTVSVSLCIPTNNWIHSTVGSQAALCWLYYTLLLKSEEILRIVDDISVVFFIFCSLDYYLNYKFLLFLLLYDAFKMNCK